MKTTGKQLTLDELMRSPTIKRVPQMVLFEPAICHIMGWKPREKVTKPELPTEQKAFLEMHGKDENTLRNIILRTKDPDEKQAALNRLGEMLDQLIDPFSFCIIAAYAEDPKIRKAAFERITTEEDFSRVRRWSNFEDTKLAAAKKLERLKKQKETPAPQTKEELLEEIARNSAGYHYDHISAGMNMGQVLGTYYGHDVSSVIREQLDKINRYWSSEPLKDEIVNAFHSISPKSPFVKNLFFKKNDDFTSFGFVTFESKGKRTPTGHLHYFFISVMMPNKSADLLFDLIKNDDPTIVNDLYKKTFPEYSQRNTIQLASSITIHKDDKEFIVDNPHLSDEIEKEISSKIITAIVPDPFAMPVDSTPIPKGAVTGIVKIPSMAEIVEVVDEPKPQSPLSQIVREIDGIIPEVIEPKQLPSSQEKRTALVTISKDQKDELTSDESTQLTVTHLNNQLLDALNNLDSNRADSLIHQGANVDLKNLNNETLLIQALYRNNPEIAILLIELGADVNATDVVGWTPLMNAIDNNMTEVAVRLIKKDAHINVISEDGKTPLSLAREKKNEEIEFLLKKLGAKEPPKPKLEPHEQEHLDNRLLGCVEHFMIEESKEFLEKGANPNCQFSNGTRVLGYAIENGYVDLAELLIDYKADINFTNEEGETPLMMSLRYNLPKLAKILIENGSDLNSKNIHGANVLRYAVARSTNEIAEYLMSKGAKGAYGKAALIYRKIKRPAILLGVLGAVGFGAYHKDKMEDFITSNFQSKSVPVKEDKSWLIKIKLENARKAIYSKSPTGFRHGISILVKLPEEKSVGLLVGMLNDDDLAIRKKATYAIGVLANTGKDFNAFKQAIEPLEKQRFRYAKRTIQIIKVLGKKQN